MGEQVARQGHPFRAVVRVVLCRRGASGFLAHAHQQLERRHLRGFHDALAELGLDALGEAARIPVLMAEGARARGHG